MSDVTIHTYVRRLAYTPPCGRGLRRVHAKVVRPIRLGRWLQVFFIFSSLSLCTCWFWGNEHVLHL